MIGTITAWWRRTPVKQPEPHYANWTAIGLGDQSAFGVGAIDGDRLKAIFKAAGAQQLIEIKRQ